jgi:outer membrane protein TolC
MSSSRVRAGLFGFALVADLLCAGVGRAAPRGGGDAPDATLRARLEQKVARPGGLRAEEVGARVAATSPGVQQREEDRAAAAAAVGQALVGYAPQLALQGRYVRLSKIDAPLIGDLVVAPGAAPGPIAPGAPLANVPVRFPVLLDQTTLQATLVVPLLDYVWRLPQLHAAAIGSREAAALSERAARLQAASDGRLAYYAWARARLQVVVAEDALAQARRHLERLQHVFNVGSAPKADVLRVEAQVAASELFLARAHDLERVLEDRLRTAMHDHGRRRYEIGEDLRVELKPLPAGEVSQLFAEAWHSRLELRALAAAAYGERAHAAAGRAAALPHLDAFGDLVYANPNPRFFPQHDAFDFTWDAGVQLRWSPNEAAQALFGGRAGDARARRIDAQLAELKDALRGEVMQAYQAAHEADLAIETTARRLDAAEESYRARRALFQNGRATSVELTDAETELTGARLDAVGARIDQRVARVRLWHATGRDVAQAR